MRELGFPVDRVLSKASEGEVEVGEAELRSVCRSEKPIDPRPEEGECDLDWVVELPVPVWDEEIHQGWLKGHDASSRLCRLWAEELCETQNCPELLLGIAKHLSEAERFY